MVTVPLVKVDFFHSPGVVRAVVREAPEIEATAVSEQDALEALYPEIEKRFQARVGSVVVRGVDIELTEQTGARPHISNERLLQLAKKRQPPQSWFDEEQDDLF